MSEVLLYAIGALLISFTLGTFFLSRIQTDVFPEDYEFKLDPFWYIVSLLFLGGVGAYMFFPERYDMVNDYGYLSFALPPVLAAIIYFFYLLDAGLFANIATLVAAAAISFLAPDEMTLFPALSFWQNKGAVIFILFGISKAMGLMNGLGAIGSMQFLAVMCVSAILTYIGVLPELLAVVAAAYAGVMLSFFFFSWPPEKIAISDGAFSAIGFIMGAFMLFGTAEYSEASMFIAASYMIAETGIFLYRRFICNQQASRAFMLTSYYRTSNDGEYETAVVTGVLKIMFLDGILAVIQSAANERLALPLFAVALNIWLLSILSGDTKPEELLSISKWSKKALGGLFFRKKKRKG